jgi:hypothetical protein
VKDIFHIATAGGCAFAGVDAGTVEVGKAADIMLIDLKHPVLCAGYDLISDLVYAGEPGMVDTLICNGKFLMKNHVIPGEAEIVAATANATYTAQYKSTLIFNPVIRNEDFSETVVNAEGVGQKLVDFTAFNFTAKLGSFMKTVGDTDKYLQVVQKAGTTGDAVINLLEESHGGLAALMGDYKKVTFSFDLKKEADTQLPVITEFSVRTRPGSEKFKFVTIDGEGNVKLFGDKALTTLTDTFKNIAVTIDFEAGTVDGYVDGAKIDSTTFTSPKAGETTAEYLARMNIYIFDCWIAQSSACENKELDVAFGIDNINIVVGDLAK